MFNGEGEGGKIQREIQRETERETEREIQRERHTQIDRKTET